MSRVVIGGGLFGCYAALRLADLGHDVLVVEQSDQLLTRASLVNQARLHTGLHYPRSLLTATAALGYYRAFRARFPEAVRDFNQVYAVAANNSKTTGADFASFVSRLDVEAEEVDPARWFHPATVSRAFRVEEPSFDAAVLRKVLARELAEHPRVTVMLGKAVTGGVVQGDSIELRLSDGSGVEAGGLVIAAYAGTNAVRRALGLAPLPLTFEHTEVILGQVAPELHDYGFTVMDGPFWSLMPFGHTGEVSLTSVGLTPLRRNTHEAEFGCQQANDQCTPLHLAECTSCPVRPPSAAAHQIQQMSLFLKKASAFRPSRSLLTVKAVLAATEVDDARPTVIQKEADSNVVTVFSGKVSTLFDLDKELV